MKESKSSVGYEDSKQLKVRLKCSTPTIKSVLLPSVLKPVDPVCKKCWFTRALWEYKSENTNWEQESFSYDVNGEKHNVKLPAHPLPQRVSMQDRLLLCSVQVESSSFVWSAQALWCKLYIVVLGRPRVPSFLKSRRGLEYLKTQRNKKWKLVLSSSP